MSPNRPTLTSCAIANLIDGAMINGVTASPGTLADLEAEVGPGATLMLPAGTLVGTAGIGAAGTLAGSGLGKTIINATGARAL